MTTQFKIGDIVTCIDNNGNYGLTKGKQYEVIGVDLRTRHPSESLCTVSGFSSTKFYMRRFVLVDRISPYQKWENNNAMGGAR